MSCIDLDYIVLVVGLARSVRVPTSSIDVNENKYVSGLDCCRKLLQIVPVVQTVRRDVCFDKPVPWLLGRFIMHVSLHYIYYVRLVGDGYDSSGDNASRGQRHC